MIAITLLSIVISFGLFCIYNKFSRIKNFPPGPFNFPIFGTLPQLAISRKPFLKKFEEYRKIYGDIFSIRFGTNNVVILNEFSIIKNAFNDNNFAGRPLYAPLQALAGDGRRAGILVSEGTHFEIMKTYAVKQLGRFGYGKISMEEIAHDNIVKLLEEFDKEKGQLISTDRRFNIAILNTIWQVIGGKQFELNDTQFKKTCSHLKTFVAAIGTSAHLYTMNWLIKLFPKLIHWNEFEQSLAIAKSCLRQQIAEHEQTFDELNLRDYIDGFLKEIKDTKNPSSPFYGKVGEQNLLAALTNLFAAGSETTSTTLNWSLMYLTCYPEVQKKLQSEIDAVIGQSRFPNLSDKQSMPYASAVIQEVLRMSSMVPVAAPHRVIEDITFHGYFFPKDTVVFANLYAVHHDQSVWGDPDCFRPERFLTPNETEIDKTHPQIVPFSVGRRKCLGEATARNNFFLFLISILQKFTITNPEKISLIEPSGFLRVPPNFKLIFENR